MNGFFKNARVVIVLISIWCVLGLAGRPAAAGDINGWEKDGRYNKFYQISEMDEFKAKVVEIKEITPLEGMSSGMALVVSDKDDELITVHVGPKSFVEQDVKQIRKGAMLKIRGAWAEIGGEDVFMASKIKGKKYTIKVRLTGDGTPLWTMSPEEAAKERASD